MPAIEEHLLQARVRVFLSNIWFSSGFVGFPSRNLYFLQNIPPQRQNPDKEITKGERFPPVLHPVRRDGQTGLTAQFGQTKLLRRNRILSLGNRRVIWGGQAL